MITLKLVALIISAASLFLLGNSLAFADPPQSLYGKSIVVSWTEQRMQRPKGEGQFRPATRLGEFSVYVSSAGRIFNRFSMTNPKRGQSGATERVGDTKKRNVEFEDRTMMVTQHGISGGARRTEAVFDESYASCTAKVIMGKEEGSGGAMLAPSAIRPGVVIEIASVKTSGVRCAVKDGNVFGEE